VERNLNWRSTRVDCWGVFWDLCNFVGGFVGMGGGVVGFFFCLNVFGGGVFYCGFMFCVWLVGAVLLFCFWGGE